MQIKEEPLIGGRTSFRIHEFGNYFDLAQFIAECPPRLRAFHEWRKDDGFIKPHLDVDMPRENAMNSAYVIERRLMEAVNSVIETCRRDLSDPCRIENVKDAPELIVMTSHGENKLSYHVVVDGMCLRDMNDAHHFGFRHFFSTLAVL